MSRIDGIKLKAHRADKHIAELKTALETFHRENRNFVSKKVDPQTGDHIYYVTAVPQVPPLISGIAGDVLQNLRSALDHLAYQLVAIGTGKTPPKHIYFPIAQDANEYMSPKFRRKIEGASNEAIKRIDALKPYKGGNDFLWQLARLNNIDKHRLLLTTAMRYKHRRSTLVDFGRMRLAMPKADPGVLSLVRYTNFGGPTEPLKLGDVVYVKPAILNLKKGMEFTFEVAFDESKIIECRSVFEALYDMFKLVSGVIIPRFADLL